MATFCDYIRRGTTFLLAVLLWLHALFFVNFQSAAISECTRLLRLSSSELVLLALLIAFSFLAASGFRKTLGSLAYIYGFPFVLLGYALYGCFLLLRSIHRWIKSHSNAPPSSGQVGPKTITVPVQVPESPGKPADGGKPALEFLRLLARPFRRFMLLWCILLLVTTHVAIAWVCLVVVLVHLARRLALLRFVIFAEPWLRRAGADLLTQITNHLAALANITRDVIPDKELRALWASVSTWSKVLNFLSDRYVLSRWTLVFVIVFLGSVYTYVAVLFSFAYYGVGRVSGLSYSWPTALVTSLFIPLYASNLPPSLAMRVLGGIQGFVVLALSVGTAWNFLRGKIDAVHAAVSDLQARLAEQTIQEKYRILEEKCAVTTTPALPAKDTTR